MTCPQCQSKNVGSYPLVSTLATLAALNAPCLTAALLGSGHIPSLPTHLIIQLLFNISIFIILFTTLQ